MLMLLAVRMKRKRQSWLPHSRTYQGHFASARRIFRHLKGSTHALAANGFLTYWLNLKFNTGAPVQSINPGYVNTKMVEGGGFFMRLLSRLFAIEPEKAAVKIVHVLLDQGTLGIDGAFFDGTKEVGFRKGIAGEPEQFDQIWKLSLELAEMKP